MIRKLLKIVSSIISLLLVLVIGLVIFLTVTEYRPEDRQPAERVYADQKAEPASDQLTLYSWNIGYAGLGKESDFFMDGGEMVNPPSQETVEKNMAGIQGFMQANPAQVWLLQEIDLDSSRSGNVDQLSQISQVLGGSNAFSYNYKCAFVPIPFPPIGQMASGIATVTSCAMDANAERIALPCPFSWPVSIANLKRGLLVTRLDVENTDKELVIVNLHLEAYDDGEGKIAQTKLLMEVLQEEYQKGNYVIAGGDFNQTFPGGLEKFPISDPEKWTPGVLENTMLPEGWQFACDISTPTCRLLDQPYSPACQLYVIDGFIVSPNVQVDSVETVSLNFEYSDHNPVQLKVTLLQEQQAN